MPNNTAKENRPDWKKAGFHFFPLGMSMRHEFGQSVWKVSIDAGFSCPNIDGTVGVNGCVFCNSPSFSPSRRLLGRVGNRCGVVDAEKVATNGSGELPNVELSIRQQIDEGIRQLRRRYRAEKFLAYFQPSTNTHAAPDRLETVYRAALEHTDIVGLVIGTRPDVLPNAVLDLLAELSKNHWLQLEIGLQSIHDRSLKFLNRGHNYQTFVDAFHRVRQRGLRIGVHLILGIPGETRDDLRKTAREVARLNPESVKLHNLYVVRDTKLADFWTSGNLVLPTLEEYASMVVDFLELLPPDIVIERISGEADADYLVAPDWAGIKHAARNAIDQEFRRRNSCQGKKYF